MGSTRETDATGDVLFSVRLPADPSSVSVARRHLREALAHLGREDLEDDAVLLLSEIVTNALLHAGSEIGVEASYDGGLLVRVRDGSPHLPRLRSYGDSARTGRGLMLVETVAEDWGYDRIDGGKQVWARITGAGPVGSGPVAQPPALSVGLEDEAPPSPAAGSDTVSVELRDVPLLILAAWREHGQAMLRDFLLASMGSDDDPAPIQVHAEITDALALVDEQMPRLGVDLEVSTGGLLVDAVEPLVTAERVVLRVPRASVAHFATMMRASDDAITLAAEGRMLTPPTQPEIRALRRWVCTQVLEQAAGGAPEPWRMPADDVVPVTAPAGWDPVEVTGSTGGRIAANAESRMIAVSPAAAALLGYDDPVDLLGRRLLVIIPERLRQAHVAGMTMFVLTDRRPLLDQVVTVPVVRRDGSEIPVDLLLHQPGTDADRSLIVAEIGPAGG